MVAVLLQRKNISCHVQSQKWFGLKISRQLWPAVLICLWSGQYALSIIWARDVTTARWPPKPNPNFHTNCSSMNNNSMDYALSELQRQRSGFKSRLRGCCWDPIEVETAVHICLGIFTESHTYISGKYHYKATRFAVLLVLKRFDAFLPSVFGQTPLWKTNPLT